MVRKRYARGCRRVVYKGGEREREKWERIEKRDGSRRVGKGIRGALLQHLRHQQERLSESLPGGFHAHFRRAEDPRRFQHRCQAHLPPFSAVPPLNLHRRLPALRRQRRHARLRQRKPSARRRTAHSQVQPGTLPLLGFYSLSDPSLSAINTRFAFRSA